MSFDNYKPEISRPERWLNRIAVHTAAHYRERARHRYEELVQEDEFPVLVDESKSADELLISDQERLMVLELLHQLDVDAHSILVAHDLGGVPMADLAQQRGIPLSTAYKWRARALDLFHDVVAKRRREERRREGRRFVLPLDLAALFATTRVAPRVPDDVQMSILRGVQESARALKEGSAGKAAAGVGEALKEAAAWLKGLVKLAQQLLPTVGVGPLVVAPVVATAAAGALWLALRTPEPPPPTVRHVAPAIITAVPPPPPVEPMAAPEEPAPPEEPPAPEPVQAPPRRTPVERRARVPAPVREERAPAPVAPEVPAVEGEVPGSSLDIALFEACSAAVQRREPTRAIAALERYEREMPQSAFGMERKVLWIRALLLAGRLPEARTLLDEALLDPAIDRRLLDELEEALPDP